MKCALLLLLLSSCSVVVETGTINQAFGLQVKDTRRLNAQTLSIRPTIDLIDTRFVTLDGGIGPTLITSPMNAWGAGVEQHLRLRYKMTPIIEPYLINVNGILYTQGLGGTDVWYGFFTAFGAGAQINLSERLSVTVDYRWHHISNGMTFHSDNFRQFFGLEKPSKNEGHEDGGVFAGVVWRF